MRDHSTRITRLVSRKQSHKTVPCTPSTMHRHYTASADKPVNVNANQHSAALRSPPPAPRDACYLARAISRSEQHHAALGTAVSRARYPRGACVPLIPASQSQKQGAQASNSNSNNRLAVRMCACSCIKCLVLHYVTATTKTPTLYTMPVLASHLCAILTTATFAALQT